MATKIVGVVGVTFVPYYPTNLHLLADITTGLTDERLPVILVRNPANPYDANAVEIHIPALGEMAMIGHVPRDQAARLAPLMDSGIEFVAEVAWCRIDPAHYDKLGIDVAVRRAPARAESAVT